MSLEQVIAAPFRDAGGSHLSEQEFVVALSLHRDWFSPAQAKRVVELATEEGLLERVDEGLHPALDPKEIRVPSGFVPAEDVLSRRSTFEEMLERLVAGGCDKREAVGDINRIQGELHLTIEAAAAVYASRAGIDLGDAIDRARREFTGEDAP